MEGFLDEIQSCLPAGSASSSNVAMFIVKARPQCPKKQLNKRSSCNHWKLFIGDASRYIWLVSRNLRNKVDTVRASRDGHEFHEAWAARQSLRLILHRDNLVGIAVEGLAVEDQKHASSETVEIADLVFYYGAHPRFRDSSEVCITQAKYSISKAKLAS